MLPTIADGASRRSGLQRVALLLAALAIAASLAASGQLSRLTSIADVTTDPVDASAVVVGAVSLPPQPSLAELRTDARALHVHPWRPIEFGSLGAVAAAKFQAALERAQEKFELAGVSFAVIRRDRDAWAGGSGFGLDGTPASGASPYVAGSITKTFVATLALELVEEGRLALDASVVALLPGLELDPAITVEQLLHHSSGLADLFYPIVEELLAQPERSWTAAEVVASSGKSWFEPGTSWAYSNTNYVLLGMVLEQVCGCSLADEVRDRYLDPLELTATRAEWALADGETGLLERSWATSFGASGAMDSTAEDLARWAHALYRGEVLERGSLERMLTFDDHDYGLGARQIVLDGQRAVGHTGLLRHWTSAMLLFPDHGTVVTLMTNRAPFDPSDLLLYREPGEQSLLDLALGIEPPKPRIQPHWERGA